MNSLLHLCFGDHAEYAPVGELDDMAKEGVFIVEMCDKCEVYKICKDFTAINKKVYNGA